MYYAYFRLSKDVKKRKEQTKRVEAYASEHDIKIDGVIEVAPYSKKMLKQKRINHLLEATKKGDIVIVSELSQLGRNMLEILNIIEQLDKAGVALIFVKEEMLSTTQENPLKKEVLEIYRHFSAVERNFIAARTKEGLAAVKAKGIKLGRPKGHRNKERALDGHRDEIMELLNLGVNLTAIRKIVNQKMSKALSYSSYKYFIEHDEELLHARHNYDKNSLFH